MGTYASRFARELVSSLGLVDFTLADEIRAFAATVTTEISDVLLSPEAKEHYRCTLCRSGISKVSLGVRLTVHMLPLLPDRHHH